MVSYHCLHREDEAAKYLKESDLVRNLTETAANQIFLYYFVLQLTDTRNLAKSVLLMFIGYANSRLDKLKNKIVVKNTRL